MSRKEMVKEYGVPYREPVEDSTKARKNRLEPVAEALKMDLSSILDHSPDFSINDKTILLEDRIWETWLRGIWPTKALTFSRLIAILNFSPAVFEIKSSHVDYEEGGVFIKWKWFGSPFWSWRVPLYVLKILQLLTFREGISTYYVNYKGLIYKHIIDHVEHDRDFIYGQGLLDYADARTRGISGKLWSLAETSNKRLAHLSFYA